MIARSTVVVFLSSQSLYLYCISVLVHGLKHKPKIYGFGCFNLQQKHLLYRAKLKMILAAANIENEACSVARNKPNLFKKIYYLLIVVFYIVHGSCLN